MDDIRSFCPLWGQWEPDCLLGEGAFATVWKIKKSGSDGKTDYAAVRHISIPRDDSVLSSYIREGIFADEHEAEPYYNQLLQSLSDEINTMYRLRNCTNLVSYEDHMIIPKENKIGYDLFLKMELLTPLRDRIHQEMSTVDIVTMGKDIAAALSVFSENHMIHQDISTKKIYVNDKGTYKLDGYRKAEILRNEVFEAGHYSYMSPETFHCQNADIRTDIYSLGLILYRLLNRNRLPFLPFDHLINAEDNDNAIFRRLKGEPLPAPADADKELSGIVLKACAFNPDDRYSMPDEMLRDLEKYQNRKNEVDISKAGRTEVYYLDNKHNIVHPRKATQMVLVKYDENDHMIEEIWGYPGPRGYHNLQNPEEKNGFLKNIIQKLFPKPPKEE